MKQLILSTVLTVITLSSVGVCNASTSPESRTENAIAAFKAKMNKQTMLERDEDIMFIQIDTSTRLNRAIIMFNKYIDAK